jgi:hypothetical protein
MTSTGANCGTCGNALGPSSQFCDQCGTPLGAVAPPPVAVTGQLPPPVATAPGTPPPAPPYLAPGYAQQPPGYAQQPPGYWQAQVAQTTNGFSIASMVLGIVWVFGLGSILAVIFGFVARRQIRRSGGRQTGGGMALAGIILGFVGIASLVLWIVLVAAVTTHFDDCFNQIRANSSTTTCGTNTGTGNSGNVFNSGNTGNAATSPAPTPSSIAAPGVPGTDAHSAGTLGFNVSLVR